MKFKDLITLKLAFDESTNEFNCEICRKKLGHQKIVALRKCGHVMCSSCCYRFVFPSNSVVTRSCWTKPWILRRHHTKYIHCTAMVASHMSWWHHTKYIDTLHCHGGCSKWLRLASSEYDVRYASYDVE